MHACTAPLANGVNTAVCCRGDATHAHGRWGMERGHVHRLPACPTYGRNSCIQGQLACNAGHRHERLGLKTATSPHMIRTVRQLPLLRAAAHPPLLTLPCTQPTPYSHVLECCCILSLNPSFHWLVGYTHSRLCACSCPFLQKRQLLLANAHQRFSAPPAAVPANRKAGEQPVR